MLATAHFSVPMSVKCYVVGFETDQPYHLFFSLDARSVFSQVYLMVDTGVSPLSTLVRCFCRRRENSVVPLRPQT